MKRHSISIALTAAALLLSANLSFAAENTADAPQQAASMAKVSPKSAKTELVDINSAKKEELKQLPGVSDADADKIIAGRPYATKAHLLTHKILPEGTYQDVKGLVIAKQPKQDAAKNAALYAPKKK
jgi:competence protein ComEA